MDRIELEFRLDEVRLKIEDSIKLINETDQKINEEIISYPLRKKTWEELILDSGVDKYRSNDEYLRYGTLIKGLEEAIYDDVFELFTIQGYEECALKELRKIENVLKKAKKKYIT